MEQNARLIIPLWGKAYADKLTSMTLPALLAPGNLPAGMSMRTRLLDINGHDISTEDRDPFS